MALGVPDWGVPGWGVMELMDVILMIEDNRVERNTLSSFTTEVALNLLINLSYFQAIRCFQQGEKIVKTAEFACQ